MADKHKKTRGNYDKSLYMTPIYRSWYNLKTRCSNPNSGEYKRYGSRGITFCEKWNTFAGFLEDMQKTHFKGASIDRIDNNKGYYKKNCRWSNPIEQANNTRNTEKALRYTYMGKNLRISEWAKMFNIKRSTLDMRIRQYRMPIELALTK